MAVQYMYAASAHVLIAYYTNRGVWLLKFSPNMQQRWDYENCLLMTDSDFKHLYAQVRIPFDSTNLFVHVTFRFP